MTGTPFLWGLGLALLGAVLVIATGQGTVGAALLGFFTAGVMVLAFGPGAMAPIALFVLGSGALTRLGRERKERMRAAEPNRGKRSAVHVAAKLGVPLVLGLSAALDPHLRGIAGAGAASALAAAFADTAATEVGPLAGGPVARVGARGLKRASHGDPGGMSVAGLAAGAAAALLVALLSRAVGLGPPDGALIAFGSGFGAMMIESLAAATPTGRFLGHFGRNFALSSVAAAAGCTMAAAMQGGAG